MTSRISSKLFRIEPDRLFWERFNISKLSILQIRNISVINAVVSVSHTWSEVKPNSQIKGNTHTHTRTHMYKFGTKNIKFLRPTNELA